jgi:hypothetical protein
LLPEGARRSTLSAHLLSFSIRSHRSR